MDLVEAENIRDEFSDKFFQTHIDYISGIYDVQTLSDYKVKPRTGESPTDLCFKVTLHKGNRNPQKIGFPDEYKGLRIIYGYEGQYRELQSL